MILPKYYWKENRSSSEIIPYQRSVARVVAFDDNATHSYWTEGLDEICPPPVFHSWELEFMSFRALKRTYALYAPVSE